MNTGTSDIHVRVYLGDYMYMWSSSLSLGPSNVSCRLLAAILYDCHEDHWVTRIAGPNARELTHLGSCPPA